MAIREDMTGKVFDRLTVLHLATGPGLAKGSRSWVCACSCSPGRTHVATTGSLNSGHVRSCGCLRVEAGKRHGNARGMTRYLNARTQPWMNLP